MSTILFEFEPLPAVVRAANSPAKVVIKANNVAFTDNIPKRYQDQGYERFNAFFQSHPLRYALSDTPTHFYPDHVCEFYFTSTYDLSQKP